MNGDEYKTLDRKVDCLRDEVRDLTKVVYSAIGVVNGVRALWVVLVPTALAVIGLVVETLRA